MNLGEVARLTPSMITYVHSQSKIVVQIEEKTITNHTDSSGVRFICPNSLTKTKIYLVLKHLKRGPMIVSDQL